MSSIQEINAQVNRYIASEVERRVRDWLVAAKGVDFTHLLEALLKSDTYFNTTRSPIFISYGDDQRTHCGLLPGEGIDLSITGLSRKNPKVNYGI